MKSSQVLVIFHIYLLVFSAYSIARSEDGNANNYIDEVLNNLRSTQDLVAKFDPLNVPDYDGGKYKIYGGVVRGLSNLYRSGNCTISYDNDIASVSGEIAVRDVTIFMNYKAKAWFIWLKGDADGKVDHLAIYVRLSVRNGKAHLREFKVANLGKYYITRINGASFILNWLVKIIVNMILANNRGQIINALETGAADALRDVLTKVQVPL